MSPKHASKLACAIGRGWQQDALSHGCSIRAEYYGLQHPESGGLHESTAPKWTTKLQIGGTCRGAFCGKRAQRRGLLTCSWGTDSCALARAAMLMRTARAQGSGKQGGGASSGSGSKPEWRSFNDRFLGLVRLHPLHYWGLSCHLCRSVHDIRKMLGLPLQQGNIKRAVRVQPKQEPS